MRLRKQSCGCAYCIFYSKLLELKVPVHHVSIFDGDMEIESGEEAFLIMDERSSVSIETLPATFN